VKEIPELNEITNENNLFTEVHHSFPIFRRPMKGLFLGFIFYIFNLGSVDGLGIRL
jgi:hypothetical protein